MLSTQFKHVESHPLARLKVFLYVSSLFFTPASEAAMTELDHKAPLEDWTSFFLSTDVLILSYMHSEDLENIQILKMRIKFSKGIALQ